MKENTICTVPKGTKVTSNNPHRRVWYTKRDMKVRVLCYIEGIFTYPATISWKGSGKYVQTIEVSKEIQNANQNHQA